MSATIGIGATVQCCVCFVPFWMTGEMQAARRRDHVSFYCPVGHAQHFDAESDIEAAQRERDEARAARDKAWVERDKAERERDDLQKRVKRATRRHVNGVCALCHRTFGNVARHMKTKHPEAILRACREGRA